MKKVALFVFISVLWFITGYSQQYPVSQYLGATNTLVITRGGMKVDSAFILPAFGDTAYANISPYIKNYPGTLIRVLDVIYMRNYNATQWIAIQGGGGGGNPWNLTGNANATAGSSFLGTTNNIPLEFRIKNVKSGLIDSTNKNVGLGFNTLKLNTPNGGSVGTYNVAIGHNALSKDTFGYQNVAVGGAALGTLTTNSIRNVAIGYASMNQTKTPSYDVAVGWGALPRDYYGRYNTAIGADVANFFAPSVGDTMMNNTMIGYASGYQQKSGRYNVFIGDSTGALNQSGSGNVFIGSKAGKNETGSNKLYIANTGTTSPLIKGDFVTEKISINGKVLVGGTQTPDSTMDVKGGMRLQSLYSSNDASDSMLVVKSNGGVGIRTTPANYWTRSNNYIYPATITDSIGIGTSSPDYTLDISGSLRTTKNTRLADDVTQASKVFIGRTPTSGSYTSTIPNLLTINGSYGLGLSFIRPTDFAEMVALSVPDQNTLKIGGQNQSYVDMYTNSSKIIRLANGNPYMQMNTTTTLAAGAGNTTAIELSHPITSTGANSSTITSLNIKPTYNQSTFGTGTIRGIYYNPTVTELNSSPHYAIETTSGELKFANINTSSDSTTYKPMGMNTSGDVVRMNNWVSGGGGSTPSLQDVVNVGNTIDGSGGVNDISFISNVLASKTTNISGGAIQLTDDGGVYSVLGGFGLEVTSTSAPAARSTYSYNALGIFQDDGFGNPETIWSTLLPNQLALSNLSPSSDSTQFIATSDYLTFSKSTGTSTSVKPIFTTNYQDDNYLPVPNNQQDTLATLADVRNGGGGSGTVTSVATGYGLSGGTITTSGTLLVDTATLSTKYVRISDNDTIYTTSPIMTTISGDSTIIYFNADTASVWRNQIDSLKRNTGTDSVFARKNGQWIFQYRDSVGNAGGGGGGGKIYYLNGSVSMGTFGGIVMYELGDTAITATAANFTRSTTGNIANFITDVNQPNLLQIPAGVWTIDAYLSETGGGSNHAQIYAILEKWNGSTLTTIATSPVEEITNGNTPDLYTYSISVPTTTLSLTDRIVIQFYIQNTNGKTITLYTQNGYVGEVHTTFTTGIGALNGLTAPSQTFATGTSGSDFNISSASSTHTFNLPNASATNRGALSSTDWSTFNNKIGASDTSVFQRKNIAAYSFKANNTNAAANTTDQVFRDTSGVYSSTITWTGTTPPSGTANHSYRFTRVGKQVTLNIHLNYGTAGSALTAVQMAFPTEFPTPAEPTGLGAASEMLYPATGYLNTANTVPTGTPRAALRVNPSDNGYELYLIGGAGNYKTAWISVTYYTN